MVVHERVGVLYVNLGGTARSEDFCPLYRDEGLFCFCQNDIEVKNYDNSKL